MDYFSAFVRGLDPAFSDVDLNRQSCEIVHDNYVKVTNELTEFDNLSVLRALFLSGDTALYNAYTRSKKFGVTRSTFNQSELCLNVGDYVLEAIKNMDSGPLKIYLQVENTSCDLLSSLLRDVKPPLSHKHYKFLREMVPLCMHAASGVTDMAKMSLMLKQADLVDYIRIPKSSFSPVKPVPGQCTEHIKHVFAILNAEWFLSGPMALLASNLCSMYAGFHQYADSINKLMRKVYRVPTIIQKSEGSVEVFDLPSYIVRGTSDPHLKYVTTLDRYKRERITYMYGLDWTRLRNIDFALDVLDRDAVEDTLVDLMTDNFETMLDKFHDLVLCGAETWPIRGEIIRMLRGKYSKDQLQKLIDHLDIEFLSDPVFIEATRGCNTLVDEMLTERTESLI